MAAGIVRLLVCVPVGVDLLCNSCNEGACLLARVQRVPVYIVVVVVWQGIVVVLR